MEKLTYFLPLIFAGALGVLVGIILDEAFRRRLLNALFSLTQFAQDRKAELAPTNERLVQQEKNLEAVLASLMAEESRLSAEIAQLQTAGDPEPTDLKTVSKKQAQLESTRTQINAERTKLEKRQEQAENDLAESEIGLRFSKDEIERLTVQRDAVRREISQKRTDLDKIERTETAELSPQFRTLTKEIAQLEMQTDSLREQKLESEVTRLTDKVQRLKQEVDNLRGS